MVIIKEGAVCPHAQIQREEMSPTKKIRCALVHEHVLLRQGLRRLLEDEPDLAVVAEAGDAAAALRCVFEYRPEVVIADERAFGLAAEEVRRLIWRRSPQSKIVLLSAHDTVATSQDGIGTRRTARNTSAEELVEMLRRVCQRSKPNRRGQAMSQGAWAEGELPRGRALTAREREVMKLLAEGKTVRSTASLLGLSVKTVDAHKFNLMRKLGLHNKAELVMRAIQERVVSLPAV